MPLFAAAARPLRFAPMLMLLTGGTLFGLSYSLFKTSADYGIPFLAFTFWQFLLAGAAIYLLSLARGRPMKFDWPHVRVYFILGIVGLGIPTALIVYVASRVPAGILGLNVTIEPALTYLFALILAIEKIHPMRIAGLAFAAAGVLCIVLPDASLPDPDMVWWVILAFAAPLCFATQNVLTERYWPAEGMALHLAGGMLLASALFILPFMAATDSWWVFSGPFDAGDWSLVGMAIIHVFGSWIFLEMIRTAGAVFAATVTYIETLAAVGWGVLLFGESNSVWIWAAIALLFIGLTLIHRAGRRALARHHAAP